MSSNYNWWNKLINNLLLKNKSSNNTLNNISSKPEDIANFNSWICPNCKYSLDSSLNCKRCNFQGLNKNGLFYLHLMNEDWDDCVKEKNGWISLHKKLGLYLDNPDHFFLPDGKPHLKKFYHAEKTAIDDVLQIEDFNNKTLLDIGVGTSWGDCYILKKVPRLKIIALECNDDPLIGLGRSQRLKEYHNCDYICLVADMHNIPIADNSIDIILMRDSLHHSKAMKTVFKEVHRLLKRNGFFFAINEPYRKEEDNEKEVLRKFCEPELEHGINERRPTKKEYLDSGSIINLRILNNELDFNHQGLILFGKKS